MFAGKYPSEIAGLIFVDCTDLRTEEEDRAYLQGQGFSDEAAAAHRAEQWARMKTMGAEMHAAAEAGASYYKEFRSLPALPDVPSRRSSPIPSRINCRLSVRVARLP